MVKGSANDSVRDPIKKRKKSAQEKQERRNSVSDIKEYFLSKTQVTPMPPKKLSGKKDKEKERELREVRANIKAMIEADNLPSNVSQIETNTNGDNALDRDDNADEHAKPHENTANEHDGSTTQAIAHQSDKVCVATQTHEDEILSAIKELAEKCHKMENTIEDPKSGLSVQLAKTQSTVTSLYSDIHGAVSGLKVQMEKATKIAKDNSDEIVKIQDSQKRMAALLGENKRIVQELKIMQGLVQKITQKSEANADQIMEATKRGMEQNIIIHGIDNSIELEDAKSENPMFTAKERCKHSVLKFLKEQMNVDIEIEDIWKAHRTGPYKQGKVRPMIIKLSYVAKDLILDNMSALKGKSNPVTKQVYFISEQVPEGVAENRKQVSNRVKTLKEHNEKRPKSERQQIQIVNNKILIDGELDEPEVKPPQPMDLFLDSKEQDEINLIQSSLVQTDIRRERNSEFLAYAAKARSIEEVRKLYVAVYQRHPDADHVMMAYALREKDKVKNGFCDDREFGAASRIRRILFETKSRDSVIFVVRKYGGIHLGFNRFSIIESMATEAINLLHN